MNITCFPVKHLLIVLLFKNLFGALHLQKLYDTPGVHLHHRQAAVVHSEDLPALAPRSRLRGQSFPVRSLKTCYILLSLLIYLNFLALCKPEVAIDM